LQIPAQSAQWFAEVWPAPGFSHRIKALICSGIR
jgi:hypothetical protein